MKVVISSSNVFVVVVVEGCIVEAVQQSCEVVSVGTLDSRRFLVLRKIKSKIKTRATRDDGGPCV